jgi:hypothetical protein
MSLTGMAQVFKWEKAFWSLLRHFPFPLSHVSVVFCASMALNPNPRAKLLVELEWVVSYAPTFEGQDNKDGPNQKALEILSAVTH